MNNWVATKSVGLEALKCCCQLPSVVVRFTQRIGSRILAVGLSGNSTFPGGQGVKNLCLVGFSNCTKSPLLKWLLQVVRMQMYKTT